MSNFFLKTFGGLSKEYLFRQYFFGLVIFGFFFMLATTNPMASSQDKTILIVMGSISLILYPYAHFVYDSVLGFIMGNNEFFVSSIALLIWKIFRMALIFSFSIFIAPIGLAYLYFHHSRNTI